MKKIIFQMLTTLDGFYEGPNREIDWHNVDGEFNAYAIEVLDSVDMLLFGRRTYELMAGYWPTPEALKDDPIVAKKMNDLPKVVFSRTLRTADWAHTRVVNDHIAEEITSLKRQSGKDMAIFGSSDLALTFVRLGFIDEFRIFINPVVLGKGKPLFNGLGERLDLRLLKTRTFQSGNVLLSYEPANR
jgi:dihydrofolate reductase